MSKASDEEVSGAEVARVGVSSSATMYSERFRRSDRFVYRHIAGEHLLIDLHSKARVPYFLLTPTAAVIWDRLADWATLQELARDLTARFEVGDGEAATDVSEFLIQLETMGGLMREGASS